MSRAGLLNMGALRNYSWILAAMAAFFIPVYPAFTVLAALLGILHWLVFRNGAAIDKQKKQFLLVLCGLLLWQALGLLWTDDLSTGLFHLQQKLGLLIFLPLILALPALNEKAFSRILSAFVIGCLGSSVYFLIRSYLAWKAGADYSVFQYVHLSAPFHPSYFALYLSFAMGMLVWLFHRAQNSLQKVLLAALLAAFYLLCILLQSKAGLLAATLVIPFSFWLNSPPRWRRPLLLGSVVILIAANAIALSLWLAKGESRMEQLFTLLKDPSLASENTDDANALRLIMWKTTVQLAPEAALVGYGSGDVKHQLREKLAQQGFTYAAEREFNAHNQFLQHFLSGGIPALLLLLLYLILPLRGAINRKNTLTVVLVFLLFLQFQPEAMLEAQDGILFCGFWLSLLALKSPENQNDRGILTA
jgi:O-antigen ligase